MAGTATHPYIGQIIMVGFNFPPQGWARCDGQLLPISENDALFTLIGTTYGGDGQSTFALPDLRGRVAIHNGTAPATGTTRQVGEVTGTESVTLTVNQLAAHHHVYQPPASHGEPTTNRPDNAYPALGGYYAAAANGPAMGSAPLASGGGSQPHDNMQPYLAVNFIISLFGIFPSQT